MLTSLTVPSPVGPLLLLADADELVALSFPGREPPVDAEARATPLLRRTAAQLAEYFRGERRAFDLPLRLDGTGFQQLAWRALTRIPYGETRSYGEQARAIDRPAASRAVGAANGKNPIAIIVPCHRVVGANGSLTGFGGGLPTKQWLLAHEARFAPRSQLPLQLA